MREVRRVPSVERRLSGGRRLVHAVGATAPVELAGAAPVVWDLLATTANPRQLRALVQRRFRDAPEVIAAGTDSAVGMLVDAGLVIEVET